MPTSATRPGHTPQRVATPADPPLPSSPWDDETHRPLHGSEARLYKTRMCRHFQRMGFCALGTSCAFAHGTDELHSRGQNAAAWRATKRAAASSASSSSAVQQQQQQRQQQQQVRHNGSVTVTDPDSSRRYSPFEGLAGVTPTSTSMIRREAKYPRCHNPYDAKVALPPRRLDAAADQRL